jgi:surfactin family lipopeptide synthetase A
LAEEQNVTLFSGIFSAWLLFLSQLTGQDDLVIGINTSGRMQDELEGGVGMYAKTLPIRYRIDPSFSFNQLLKNTHARLVEAQSKQIYDLADIVGELNRQREAAIKELIGAMFVYQGFESQVAVREDSEFIPYSFEQKTAKYPMSLFVTEEPDDLVFRWEYATSYFTAGDMEVLVADFKRLLQEICNNTSVAIVNLLASSGELEDVQSKEAIDFNF